MAKQFPRRSNPQATEKAPPHQDSQVTVASAQWSGPLPPPAALEKFNQIIPNGADRIMRMVESEQASRHALEEQQLKHMASDVKRGHWIGLAFGVACVAGCVFTAHIGAHPAVSIALVSLPIGLMIKHILGRK
jgi:uncharacterized membrane protein